MTNDNKTSSRAPLWVAIAVLSALLLIAVVYVAVTVSTLHAKEDELSDTRFRAESTQRLLDEANEFAVECHKEAEAWKSSAVNMTNSVQAWLAIMPYGQLDLSLSIADVETANELTCIE